ncbi:hypothetical protein BDW22DRAFT_1426198 [Trametopsis cervina]|nr:hypothetical protein BDW22DRAFT_1426198 [Trametopsis cervina]
MELSKEVYGLVVRHVRTRSDLLSLSMVSKNFQREAEKALYNTLHLRGRTRSTTICTTLSSAPRVAAYVEALSLFIDGGQEDNGSEDAEEDEEVGESDYSDEFWDVVASALRRTTKLRFLSVYLERVPEVSQARILDGCSFQLHTFHCEFAWDTHLETFLRSQTVLIDLYLADYRELHSSADTEPQPTAILPSLPALECLECTFSEAAMLLIPGRPVVRVKTCFSRNKTEKHAELQDLLANLKQSRKSLRALDLADESYDSGFTLEMLALMIATFAHGGTLRYLGTLVFPVDGKERITFYTRLMRLPRLRCVELELTEWEPPPMTPAALRALTYELRIYCPSIDRVIYVYDFDRVVMKVEDNVCVLDSEAVADNLWREV